jgi:pyruvate dehydrogenase E1 component
LRSHFEVDRNFITLATLKALADRGDLDASRVAEALVRLGIDPEKANPIMS